MDPAEALARSLRAVRGSSNTEAAGEADAEDAFALLRHLEHLGWELVRRT